MSCIQIDKILSNPEKMTKEEFVKNLFNSMDKCVPDDKNNCASEQTVKIVDDSYVLDKKTIDNVLDCVANHVTSKQLELCNEKNTKTVFIFFFFNLLLIFIIVKFM